MTNQEKIQEIREACIKANPEIVELKFGCEFLYSTVEKPEGQPLTLLKKVKKDDIFIDTYSDYFGYYRTEKIFVDGIKIIGRPIRLDDCANIMDLNGKIWLVQKWKIGYLDDQTEKTLDGIKLRML